jgi:hypothetical protein
MKLTKILILLLVIIAGGSACSLGRINAQSPTGNTETTQNNNTNNTNSSKTKYEPPKRISKDIIKTDEKLAKSRKFF